MNAAPRPGLRKTVAAALLVIGVSINPLHAGDSALLKLTAEHFEETADVADDPAGGTTAVSTERGWVERTGPMRMVWHDEFLNAVIDGKTGRKSYQVKALVIYSGTYRSYETAAFSAPDGPQSVKITSLQKSSEFCATGACTYTERVAFPVEEKTLRQAAQSATGHPTLWRFELVARTGPRYEGALSTAEIAGFLAKVDESASRAPVARTAPTAAALAAQFDLGIEGIPVAATQEQPKRGGILIASVKSGSAAQKAGMIVGDIVYEFGDRPIATIADLQAAAAAAAAASGANSTTPLRLYRGMNSMTVRVQF